MDHNNLQLEDTVLSMEQFGMDSQNPNIGALALEQSSQDSCHDDSQLPVEKGEIDVKVKKVEFRGRGIVHTPYMTDYTMPEYKMTAYPRGLALIIENDEFQNNIHSKRYVLFLWKIWFG